MSVHYKTKYTTSSSLPFPFIPFSVSYFIINASVSTCLAQWWFQSLLLSENRNCNKEIELKRLETKYDYPYTVVISTRRCAGKRTSNESGIRESVRVLRFSDQVDLWNQSE